MKSIFNIFGKNSNLELKSATYSLNLFIPTLIIIIISIFQNYELVSELSIIVGFNIILTQIFSANSRALIIRDNSKKLINIVFVFRIFIIVVSLIINIFLLFLFETIYFFELLLFCIVILQQWVTEIVLTKNELLKNKKIFISYNFFSITFIILSIFLLFFDMNIIFAIILFNLYLFFNLMSFYLSIDLYKLKSKDFKKFLFTILKSNQFYSSFSLSFANFVWRILVIYFCGKVIAGVYFAGFAIGSLPGTLFNNTFGPALIRNNYNINKNWIKFFNLVCLVSLIVSILILIYLDYFGSNIKMQILCSLISISGSYFMFGAMIKRQIFIQKAKNPNLAFKYDVLVSFFIIFIIPVLFVIGGTKMIIFSFFMSSIISNIVYRILLKNYF